MAKKGDKSGQNKKADDQDATPADNKRPSPDRWGRPLHYAALAGIGVLNTLWAAFLWAELLVARQGGTPFCAVGEGLNCMALWDGGFAKAVHNGTGMPVAGWGVVFGILTVALPLVGLLRAAEGRPSEAIFTSVRLTGLVGALSIVGLLIVSASAGSLCIGCLGTYVLTGAFAAVALIVLQPTEASGFLPDMGGGAGIAAGTAIATFLALLYPGLSTPKSLATQERDAIQQMADATGSGANKTSNPQQQQQQHDPQQQHQAMQQPEDPGSRLTSWLSGAPLQLKQGLSDSLHIYKTSPNVPLQPARSVIGDPNAKLLITDFTDARCGHCAQLHETLAAIHDAVPPDSFKVEARHFPLDGNCNPKIQRKSDDGVSCWAAKAQICMEGHPKAYDFTSDLFKNGPTLNTAKVWELAGKYADVSKLKACAEQPDTLKKLADDILWAEAHQLEGTPLVLLNGKKATSFGPFLFAMILTGGDPNHPALAGLPPPNTEAHVH